MRNYAAQLEGFVEDHPDETLALLKNTDQFHIPRKDAEEVHLILAEQILELYAVQCAVDATDIPRAETLPFLREAAQQTLGRNRRDQEYTPMTSREIVTLLGLHCIPDAETRTGATRNFALRVARSTPELITIALEKMLSSIQRSGTVEAGAIATCVPEVTHSLVEKKFELDTEQKTLLATIAHEIIYSPDPETIKTGLACTERIFGLCPEHMDDLLASLRRKIKTPGEPKQALAHAFAYSSGRVAKLVNRTRNTDDEGSFAQRLDAFTQTLELSSLEPDEAVLCAIARDIFFIHNRFPEKDDRYMGIEKRLSADNAPASVQSRIGEGLQRFLRSEGLPVNGHQLSRGSVLVLDLRR